MAESIPELPTFLEENRIEPGQQVKVVEVLPFNQTVTLDVLGQQVALGNTAAKQIIVEV